MQKLDQPKESKGNAVEVGTLLPAGASSPRGSADRGSTSKLGAGIRMISQRTYCVLCTARVSLPLQFPILFCWLQQWIPFKASSRAFLWERSICPWPISGYGRTREKYKISIMEQWGRRGKAAGDRNKLKYVFPCRAYGTFMTALNLSSTLSPFHGPLYCEYCFPGYNF